MTLITEEKLNELRERSEAQRQEALASPQTSQQSEVGSGEWVEELAQKWERRLLDRQPISLKHGEDKGANYQLKQCLDELRACAESSYTVRDEIPLAATERKR